MKRNKFDRKPYENRWERGTQLKERLPPIQSPFLCGIITGFAAGEGSFCITIKNNKSHRTGYQVYPSFCIGLKKSDAKILYMFKDFFGCGKVYFTKKSVQFVVARLNDLLEVIIPFFDKYPIPNIKEIDFQYFKIICYKLMWGDGKKQEGLARIRTITECMNLTSAKQRRLMMKV